ncbi:MAG: hypothetical protein RBU37_11120 [Myxococcota bacterium]|nr:hypothetical protein [Myxococcota bacterium]
MADEQSLSFLPEPDFDQVHDFVLAADQARLRLEPDSIELSSQHSSLRFDLNQPFVVQLGRARARSRILLTVELRQRLDGDWHKSILLGPCTGSDEVPFFERDGVELSEAQLRSLLARLRAAMQLGEGERWQLPEGTQRTDVIAQRVQHILTEAKPLPQGLRLKAGKRSVTIRDASREPLLWAIGFFAGFYLALLSAPAASGISFVLFALSAIPFYLVMRSIRPRIVLSPAFLEELGQLDSVRVEQRYQVILGTGMQLRQVYRSMQAMRADWVAQAIAVYSGLGLESCSLGHEANRWPSLDDDPLSAFQLTLLFEPSQNQSLLRRHLVDARFRTQGKEMVARLELFDGRRLLLRASRDPSSLPQRQPGELQLATQEMWRLHAYLRAVEKRHEELRLPEQFPKDTWDLGFVRSPQGLRIQVRRKSLYLTLGSVLIPPLFLLAATQTRYLDLRSFMLLGFVGSALLWLIASVFLSRRAFELELFPSAIYQRSLITGKRFLLAQPVHGIDLVSPTRAGRNTRLHFSSVVATGISPPMLPWHAELVSEVLRQCYGLDERLS